jgi:hypothetical protein
MEPRALAPACSTVFKEMKDSNLGDLEKTERALSELSLNNGIPTFLATTDSRF